MSKKSLVNQAPDITAEACAWIAQLETGDLTPADLEAFREWTQRSPRHASEIRRLARLSADLVVLSELEPAIRHAAAHYRPVIRDRRSNNFLSVLNPRVLTSVAGLLLIVSALLYRADFFRQEPITIITQIGGYAEQTLPDGSVVKLNTDSHLEVNFERKQRNVSLRKGEAFFEVAHNPEVPFIVHANGKVIRAVGTAFAVRINRDDFQVTVTEGRVELKDEIAELPPENNHDSGLHFEDEKGGQSLNTVTGGNTTPVEPQMLRAVLNAGQQIIISENTQLPLINVVSEEDIRRNLSWREGLFDFSDTPLQQVVREFDRYTDLNIEIADPDLKDRKFSGIFPTGDIVTLLEVLETSYGIVVIWVDSKTIRLDT